MTKLSLWLVTMDKGRPFTFLDHALKAGDSIVGVNLDQLMCWDLEGSGERRFETLGIQADIERMIALRQEIAATPVRDTRDQQHKAQLLAQADAVANHLKTGADLLVGSYYNTLNKTEQQTLRDALLRAFRDGEDVPEDIAVQAALDGLRPFHWPLEFPEVFDEYGGFDAFVGNPPFMGGRHISGRYGDAYLVFLLSQYTESGGQADYCAYFFRRTWELVSDAGVVGLLATNSISEGDTRRASLEFIISNGGRIFNAKKSFPWPGDASLHVSVVHFFKHPTEYTARLNGRSVVLIDATLDPVSILVSPERLRSNKEIAFKGTGLGSSRFVLSEEELHSIPSEYLDLGLIKPYINSNSHYDFSP